MRPIYAETLKQLVDEEWFDCQEKSSFFDEIDRTPTIEPRRGKWETEVRTIRGHKIPFFACSVCGRNADDEYPYCPNCGARMSDECAD